MMLINNFRILTVSQGMGQGHVNHEAPLTIAIPGQPCKKHAILSSHHTAYFIGFTPDSIARAGHDDF